MSPPTRGRGPIYGTPPITSIGHHHSSDPPHGDTPDPHPAVTRGMAIGPVTPAELGVWLARLPDDDPYVVATTLATEMRARRAEAIALAAAGHTISAAADWRRIAVTHVSHDELCRRRAQLGPPARPTGDAA